MTNSRTLLAILVSLVALGLPNPSAAVDSYAAFAVVPGKGAKYHGYARGKNPFAASQSALRACGNFGCKIVQQYSVGQCAHIVLGTYQVFWNDTGFSKSRGAEILAHCKKFDEGCKTIVRDCIS